MADIRIELTEITASMPPPAPVPPPRTAVIVIAGLGDKPSGSGSVALTAGLLRHCSDRFASSECTNEEYAPHRSWCGEPRQDAQTVTRHTLFDAEHRPVADVYEAWWADLSRFPGATRSAFLAALGMLQQATTVGRAALRGGGAVTANPADEAHRPREGTQSFGVPAALLGVIEWLVAVPIVCITAILLAMLGVADYAMSRDGATSTGDRVGLCVVSALAIGGLALAVRWYASRRLHVVRVAVPLVVAAFGLAIWQTHASDGFADRGIADAIFAIAVYPLRVAWMAVAALALVALAWASVQRRLEKSETYGWRRIGTASVSMFGPFGLAILGALAFAAAAAAVQKPASLAMAPPRALPWCLDRLTSWRPVGCGGSVHNAFDWGTALFETAVIPMMYVAGAVVLTVLGTAAFLAITSVRRHEHPWRITQLRRITKVAPLAVAWALAPAVAVVLLTYVPGGDHILVWQQGSPHDIGSPAALLAAAAGWVIGGLLTASRLMKLNLSALRGKGTISNTMRVPLDLAYDIATYLREPNPHHANAVQPPGASAAPNPRDVVPRQRIVGRLAALLAHIKRTRHYDSCLIVSHSQGTVIATALLAEPRGTLSIPGDHVALVTMGSPLRHIYAERLPEQFCWVRNLAEEPQEFVKSLDGPWINLGADDDLVGRTVFSQEREGSLPYGEVPNKGEAQGLFDWMVGPGDHGSYWDSREVMRIIAELIPETIPTGNVSGHPPASVHHHPHVLPRLRKPWMRGASGAYPH
ncbi:MAG TPA: hypothetical protein VGQ42_13455 [Candidatus Dormibacteraeota bacterium]|jgi:hypothetical protein|nr:hypothetical protein [Candidatus Dormibacteraeota bacterium]